MPVLHIGDIEIVAHTQQLTSPALHIKNADGEIYHVAVMPVGGGVFDATETLVYEENTINTCQSFELPAGIYRVEMRGGTGGKPYTCSTGYGMQKFKSDIMSSIFKLSEPTTAYALRGGDGNDGATVNVHQTVGGGASGVDSILVVGNRAIRANGGTGTRCQQKFSEVPGRDGGGFNTANNGGGGGIYTENEINDGANADVSDSRIIQAPSGGGAPNGSAGITANSTSCNIFSAYGGNMSGGGNGGDIENLLGDSVNQNTVVGGRGGANTLFNCGGQVAYSYGGGGGGAVCVYKSEYSCSNFGNWCTTDCFDGGDGGSGSTGTSNDSFIKIFKIG